MPDYPGEGKGERGLKSFFQFVDTRVFLTVRQDNEPAVRLYRKVGMEKVGEITWSEGKILGDVYCWTTQHDLSAFFE